MTLKEQIKEIHQEKYDSIWETHPVETWEPDPEPFTFDYILKDKTGEEINVTVSGFWNQGLQEIEELTILDKFKNDVTELFNDRDTLRDIAETRTLS